MARKAAPNSKWSYGGLGLEDKKAEDHLKKYLKKKGISLNYFKRFLIKEWLKTQTVGTLE